jgi:hypothetical protein
MSLVHRLPGNFFEEADRWQKQQGLSPAQPSIDIYSRGDHSLTELLAFERNRIFRELTGIVNEMIKEESISPAGVLVASRSMLIKYAEDYNRRHSLYVIRGADVVTLEREGTLTLKPVFEVHPRMMA